MTQEPELNDLLDAAYEHARRVLINKKDAQLIPMWLLITDADESMIVATPFSEQTNKDLVAVKMRQLMEKHHIKAYTFLTEVWATDHPEGTDLDNVPLPSQSPDRQEAVFALACNANDTRHHCWRIKRNRQGRITALIKKEWTPGTIFGRFSNLLGKTQ